MPHSYLNFCHLEGYLRGPVSAVPQLRGEGVAFKLEVEERIRISKSEWTTETSSFDVEAGPSHTRYMLYRQDGDLLAIDGQVRRRDATHDGIEGSHHYVYCIRIRKLETPQKRSADPSL